MLFLNTGNKFNKQKFVIKFSLDFPFGMSMNGGFI
jgi:hypothetical protein